MTIQKLYIVYQKKTQQESKKSPGREIFMVGVKGLEPSAFWSQTRRSSQLSYTPFVPRARIELATRGFSVLCSTTELPRHCGPEEIRTPDLRRARAALYQLSYWPEPMPKRQFQFSGKIVRRPSRNVIRLWRKRSSSVSRKAGLRCAVCMGNSSS